MKGMTKFTSNSVLNPKNLKAIEKKFAFLFAQKD